MNLSDITKSLKRINLRDRKVQIGLIILVAGIGGSVYWYNQMYEPQTVELAALRKKVDEKQQKLNTIKAMRPQLERIRAEIVAKRILLDSLKSIFPDQKEVPKLIHEITRLSNASNVLATTFNPMADVKREYYVENRYKLAMWGGYHDFATFLSRLANLRLIINLSEVKLLTHPDLSAAMGEDDAGGVPKNTIQATFTLTTFSSRR